MNTAILENYDVAIVGAGPCGVTTANLLGKYGIKTLVIDREKDIIVIPRAVGICEEGSRVLAAAGVAESLESTTRAMDRVVFADKDLNHIFHAELNIPRNGYPTLRIFHQPDLERVIRDGLRRFEQVDLCTDTELLSFEDNGENVTLQLRQDGKVIATQCRFLLGCDGAKSQIRKALNIGFSGETYPQDWLILDIEKNPLSNNEVMFSINPERPAVTMPGPGDKRRWEFVVKNTDCRDNLFSDDNLKTLLQPWGDVKQMQVSRKAVYTFHARVAERYKKGHVFLLGDAAHITPPFAGQGMMAGLRDTYNIAWKLAAVLKGELSERILDSYGEERIPQSKQVIGFAQKMGSIILPQNPIVARIRDGVIKFLGLIGLHSESKGIILTKIPNHINGGLIRNYFISRFAKTGVEFPQHTLETADGTSALSDHLMGDNFHLLGWNCNAEKFLDANTLRRWRALSSRASTITDLQTSNSDSGCDNHGDILIDRQQQYRALFSHGKRVVVLRPDKMMIINCKPKVLNRQLNQYLDSIGCTAA